MMPEIIDNHRPLDDFEPITKTATTTTHDHENADERSVCRTPGRELSHAKGACLPVAKTLS
jgi:hypothetical protein